MHIYKLHLITLLNHVEVEVYYRTTLQTSSSFHLIGTPPT
jgi:hypothetical protein